MADDTRGVDPDSVERWPRRWVAIALGMAALLLGLTVYLAFGTVSQSQRLDDSVTETGSVIDSGVRPLSQGQRELLRLSLILHSPEVSRADLRMQRGFVSQRMQATPVMYEQDDVADDDIRATAQAISTAWFTDLLPRVQRFERRWPVPPVETRALRADLADLEVDLNELIIEDDLMRQGQAEQANNTSRELLDDTGSVLVTLLLTFAGFVGLLIVAITLYRRLDRQRRRFRNELVAAATEARVLSEVAQRTSNLVIVSDADGRIEWVNEAFERVTGHTLAECRGERPGDLLQGPGTDPEDIAIMSRHVAAGEAFTAEVLNYARDGREYYVSIEVQPVRDEFGELTNFIALESDITEAREYERLLLAAKETAEQIAEEKAQFLATMSHEIRTPLNAVIGMTELLLESELTPEQRSHVEAANNSGSMLLATISNILSYSSADSGRLQIERRSFSPTSLLERTRDLIAAQATERGVDVDVQIDERLPTALLGDPIRLQQILTNLAGNAIKFTDEGSVTLRAEAVAWSASTYSVRFTVADTGIGIPPAKLDSLFQPFTQVDASMTRTRGGSGLGLAIAARLSELMDGRLSVVSRPDEGSTFALDIDLPKAEDGDGIDEDEVAADVTVPDDLRILIAEDDAVNQTVATAMLAKLGLVHVAVAEDGIEARDLAVAGDFDIVLMDLQMPRMDGIEAMQAIHAAMPPDRRPLIVALTANALDGDQERYLTLGMDDYLSKPFRREQLAQLLRRLVRRGRPRAVEST